MPMKFYYLIITVAALSLGSLDLLAQTDVIEKDLSHFSGAPQDKDKALDRLTFSGTQKWDPTFTAFTRKSPKYLPRDWKNTIVIPEPPKNSSARTKAELNYLTTLISQRPQTKKAIEAEVFTINFKWGKHNYKELTEGPQYKKTSKLLLSAYEELAIVCFVKKQQFNRVRPSILAEKMGISLGTAIKIPSHPAYPSGHAIGSFTMAYLLQELDPANAEQYRKDAARIAHNREIAGLHYPSDTVAGRLLARQIVDAMLESRTFQSMLKSARTEWK